MILYVLWAFFIGDMAPEPIKLGVYKTKKECLEQMHEAKKNTRVSWRFSCISKGE